jgi:RNA polymerase sigma factor (sigma-70 family)
MIEDSELLRRYVKNRSQEAFTELVRRHVGLVYSCAFRRVGSDSHLAEDVAQIVFSDLARKGPCLLGRPSLSGWLYVSTQLASAELVRNERRRKTREEEASSMQRPPSVVAAPPEVDWNRMRPMLDKFILGLRDKDREALVLRFFSRQGYPAIGATLGVSEDAARKRVDRALARLRGLLAKVGATSTIEALSIVLAEGANAAPPAMLADRVAGIAFLEFTAAGTVASFLASLFNAVTSEVAVLAATMVAGALLILWQQQTNSRLRTEIDSRNQQNVAIRRLERDNRQLRNDIEEADDLRLELDSRSSPGRPVGPTAAGDVPSVPINVNVTSQGTISWEGKPVTLDEFLSRLVAYQAKTPGSNAPFLVHGELGLEFSALAWVIEQASKAGVKDIVIDSKATPSPSSNWISLASQPGSPKDNPPPSLPDAAK